MSRAEPALLRLLRSDRTLRREFEGAICDFLRKYNPDQPRVPRHNRGGGQWTRTGSGQPTTDDTEQGLLGLPLDTTSLLRQPSYSSPAAAPLPALVHEAFLDERRDEGHIEPLDPMDPLENLGPSGSLFEHGREDPFRPLGPTGALGDFGPSGDLLSSLGLELYNRLSAANGPSSQAVIKFVATGFSRDSGVAPFNLAGVEKLDREQAKAACPSIDVVQRLTDKAVDQVVKDKGLSLSPTQFGTAVHLALQQEINSVNPDGTPKYPGFQAEVSAIKTAEANEKVPYGQKDSVRVDVLVLENSDTACVYDVKSGKAGLTLPRMKEIADNARTAFGPVRYLIIIEIRPGTVRDKVAKWVNPFWSGIKNSIVPTRSLPMLKPGEFNLYDRSL